MRKVWIPNSEEVLPETDANYSRILLSKNLGMFPRFVLCPEKGDLIVVPKPVESSFLLYAAALLGLGKPDSWLITLKGYTHPYSLVDSILEDPFAIELLRCMGRDGGWIIEPFMQTPRIMRLSKETGIPTDKTHPELVWNGIISDLNDKGVFKDLARKLGIQTPEGYVTDSMPALEKAIDLAAEKYGKVMLRKAVSAGGFGNMHGSGPELRAAIGDWYSGGRILVEPFLNITSVAGSIAHLGDNSHKFGGVDAQTFENMKWTGFDYPYPDRAVAERIYELTGKVADTVRRSGARGALNLDWALVDGAGPEPVALECNFRNNGFANVMDFGRKYLKKSLRGTFVSYREGLPCGERDTAGLIKNLSALKVSGKPLLLTKPGAEEGAVLMTPLFKGKYALGFFYKQAAGLHEAFEAIKKII
jgi:hypothetical protein